MKRISLHPALKFLCRFTPTRDLIQRKETPNIEVNQKASESRKNFEISILGRRSGDIGCYKFSFALLKKILKVGYNIFIVADWIITAD